MGGPDPPLGPAVGRATVLRRPGPAFPLGSTGESGVAEELALTLALTVPLLWRERRPMLVFALTTATAVLTAYTGALDSANAGADVARLVALFNVGRFATPGQLLIALAVSLTQLVAWAAGLWGDSQPEYATRPEIPTAGDGDGDGHRRPGPRHPPGERRHRRSAEGKDQQARLAVAQERARVSKEMHDILGHTLAVIVGLADGAAGLAETKPQRGAETLGSSPTAAAAPSPNCADSSPSSATTTTGAHDAPLAPQPGLADLDPLIERVRAAGPSVTLSTDGDLTTLAPGLQLAVYRIVQEALTNTLKYAAADTSISVRVTVAHETVHIDVEDTGPLRAPRSRKAERRKRPRSGRHARTRGHLPGPGHRRTQPRRRLERPRPSPDHPALLLALESPPPEQGCTPIHDQNGEPPHMTTVLIVDDQALQRLGFSMLLEPHPDLTLIGEATHGAEAVRKAAELKPDVVLMDVRMPGMDGIEATRRIVKSGGRSRVLVLTTFDLDEYAYDALRAGAPGSCSKTPCPTNSSPASERWPPETPSSRPV